MKNTLDLTPLGEQNDYSENIVAYLHVTLEVGKFDGFIYDLKQTYQLNEHAYKIMSEHTDGNNQIKLEILDKLFLSHRFITDGEFISKSAILEHIGIKIQNEIRLCAYYMAEKDNFSQSSNSYWFQAEAYINRQYILRKALLAKGLNLRSDSKLCELWIRGRTDSSLETVVNTMVECEWCITYQNMFSKIADYKKLPEAKNLTKEEIFSIVKKHILDEHPVPEILPWMSPSDLRVDSLPKSLRELFYNY